MKPSNIWLAVLTCLFLAAAWEGSAQVVFQKLSADEIKIIDGLSGLLSKKPLPQELAEVRKATAWPSPVIRGLATLILKKHGDKSADRLLLEHFSVNDYAERAKGVQHIVTTDQMMETVKAAETACKGLKANGATMLVVFYHYRNRNQWMMDPAGTGQKIELARFFRTAYFAGIFEGTGLDPVQVSMTIDITTRKLSGVK